jgi:RNA polymerase sigma-70 factor, ECF subfamily
MVGRDTRSEVYALKSIEVANPTDHSLVERSKEGSHSAFTALIERHSRKALGTIRRIVRDHADAEDVLQEAIMKAFRHISSFDERASFSTWFTRIAINTALMLLRRKNSKLEMSLEVDLCDGTIAQYPIVDHAPNPEQWVMRRQSSEEIQMAIRALPCALRECVERKYFLEISNDEVADLLGITVAATKSRLLRARQRMRVSLEPAHVNRLGK